MGAKLRLSGPTPERKTTKAECKSKDALLSSEVNPVIIRARGDKIVAEQMTRKEREKDEDEDTVLVPRMRD